MRKMACVALNAVYIAQPSTMAKPAIWSVRSSSLRRTCRNLARSGAAVTLRDYHAPLPNPLPVGRGNSGLLHARDLFQGGDPLLDRRMGIEQVVEEAAVVLRRVVDAHRRDRVVEVLHRLLIGGDLLQRADQPNRVARQVH